VAQKAALAFRRTRPSYRPVAACVGRNRHRRRAL